ncbi:MAG: GTP-binding protein [Methanobacteriaceae archaeon]|nr:GTP-binding protein [Methanobacteriaceae archaeon]
MKKNKEIKIVILGSYNSGKTTTIENLVNRQKVTKIEYQGTTVAMDYGNVMIDGSKIHIFATPGQKRFKFMRQILSRGLNGAILVVDSSVGVTDTDQEIMDKLEKNNIPYVLFANKQDINPVKIDVENKNIPVIPTIATDGDGIQKGFEILLNMIKQSFL